MLYFSQPLNIEYLGVILFYKKGRPKAPYLEPFPFLILGYKLLMALALLRNWQGRQEGKHLKALRQELEKRQGQLQEKNRGLQEELEAIKASPLYAEKILKDLYHRKNPGESLILFPEKP